MRPTRVAILTSLALALPVVVPANAASPARATTPAPAAASTAVAAPAELTTSRARIEHMRHWTCDRAGYVDVTVGWESERKATVRWRVSDQRRDGRSVVIRIIGLDFNGAAPSLKRDFFGGSHVAAVSTGAGTSRSGQRTWTPSFAHFDELEVRVWNGLGRERVNCGINAIKRLNNFRHSAVRTLPKSYEKTKALRKRIVKVAWDQYRSGYRERWNNCSKYTNTFYAPDLCHPWCSDFAWWVWWKAGVPGAAKYNSSYTDDFRDEWRVTFKSIKGTRKPRIGDVIVYSHQTDGINGHVGVVVATDGWRVKLIHGNWGDRVVYDGHWTNPFASTSDSGRKHVIGFASPD